jgi:GNAT superfamily N-acetyltransferase
VVILVLNYSKMSILHFRKQFDAPPVVVEVPGIRVRTFVVPGDVESWLALRTRATAELAPPVRPWSADDFRREMKSKSWWRADHCWLGVAGELRVAGTAQHPGERSSSAIEPKDLQAIIGAVTLAFREGAGEVIPVVHWLLVDPRWRQRGVARVLMSQLELAAWSAGYREVQLETHANWHAAVEFYQSIGYALLRERSPR